MSKIKLNDNQQEVFQSLKKFVESAEQDTFILNGYAGTGKTFLMQQLAEYFTEEEISFKLLASTGRAAAILRGKTKYEARTVHGHLYFFTKLSGVTEKHTHETPHKEFGQMKLQFEFVIPQGDDKVKVLIFDEASMLSSEDQGETSHAVFGSGKLMQDIFAASAGTKLIFVGDPAQLPPVGQLLSPALDKLWLEVQGRKVIQHTLTKIERTQADNDILVVAQEVRKMMENPNPPQWNRIPALNRNNIKIFENETNLINSYIRNFKDKGPSRTILIARSNHTVQYTNAFIRRHLFEQENPPMQVGDILLVTQNNYLVPLSNGDFIKILEIGQTKTQANLRYTNVRIASLASGKEYEILLSSDILESYQSNFTLDQTQEAMVDFVWRMSKNRVKANSELFKQKMQSDPYLNCLKATYGYAITCHKSQGGEWEDVYVLGHKAMLPPPKHMELLRWWYTSITRAKEQIYTNQGYWIK
jgi:ATP-dependent exoDNAse (exonuclease V) alpha subunit